MTILYINTGSNANAGDGDSLRSAFNKVNQNFRYIAGDIAGFGFTGSKGEAGGYTGSAGTPGAPGIAYNGSRGYVGSAGTGYTGSAGTGGTALGDRLTAGTTATLVLLADGTLKLTHPTEWWSGAYSLEIQKAAGNYHTFKSAYGLSLQATPVPNGYGLNTNTNFVDIFHDGISVNVNDNSWGFGADGTLTLPYGQSIGSGTLDGIKLTTDRGTVLFGNSPEQCVPTQSSHFHIMRDDPTTVDLFFGDDLNYVKLPYDSTLTNVGVQIGTDATNLWSFGKDGSLTLPGGYTQISNQGIVNTASSVVLASVGATGGAALEWISDAELSTSTKIAFVIANNTLSANSGTVQIATGGIIFNGPEQPPVLENVWDFGTNGTLTIPDDIQDFNGSVIRIATTSTAPTRVNGQLWFNTEDGRGYIRYNNTWIDLNPTEVPPPSTYLDGLTISDTTISAVDTTATVSIESGSNVWEFGTDGSLTFPDATIQTTAYTGPGNTLSSGTEELIYTSNNTLTVPSDFTLFSTGNINIQSISTDSVNIFAELHVHSASAPLTEPILRVLDNGAIRMLVPAVDNLSAAVMIIGSTTTNYVSPQNTGVMEHLTGQTGTPTRIYSDGINAYAAYVGRRYDGTATSPQAVTTTSGNAGLISRIGATPYVGAVTNGGWPQLTTSRIEFRATEDQTPANQGNQIEFWTTPIGTSTIHQDISISSQGIGFRNGSYQDTAAIPLTEKGVAYGVATLGSDAKVTPAQLPAGAIIYQGAWNAATNTPFLYASSGTYTIGWEYSVSSTGTQSIDGGGPIEFYPGDYILYNGTGWDRIPGNNGSVITFNGRTGDVVMTTTDVTNVLTPGSIAASKINTPYITINPGVGLSGGGQVNLGSTVNINNVGVTSIINGGGLTISSNTGTVTLKNAGVTSITAGTGTHVSTSTDGVVVWVDLLSGPTGYTGSTGTQGVIGYTGSTGTQGVIGYTGSTGTQGVIGYTGSKGVADVYVSSISTGTGIFVTTSTGAVTVSLNTATLMNKSVTLSAMSSILAGTLSMNPTTVNKTSAAVQTFTITGLTTSHKVIITPAAQMPDKDYFIKGAWASATDTLSVEIYNASGGNIDAAAFNVSYIAFV